jgi:hypothetical protein
VFRDHSFEECVGQGLDPEREPHRIELLLPVAAVHAGNAHGDVTLVVDVLDALGWLLADDDLLQVLEDREQCLQSGLVALLVQRVPQRLDLIVGDAVESAQPVQQVVVIQLVLLADQLPQPEQQRRLLAIDRTPLRDLLQPPLEFLRLQTDGHADVFRAHEPREARAQARVLLVVDVDSLEERGRHVGQERLALPGGPEVTDRLDEADQQGIALHV